MKELNQGLGLLKGKFKSLNDLSKTIKVPHVGWNECIIKKKSNLFRGIRINLIFTLLIPII